MRPKATLECASLRLIFHTSVNTETSETGWTTGPSERSQAGQGHREEHGPTPGAAAPTQQRAKTPESDSNSFFKSGHYRRNAGHPSTRVSEGPGHSPRPRALAPGFSREAAGQGLRFKEKG